MYIESKNKQLQLEPLRGIITQGEKLADTVTFSLPNVYGNLTLSQLSWDIRAASEKNTLVSASLSVSVNIDRCLLVWEVSENFTAVSGSLSLMLVGTDSNGKVVIKFPGDAPIWIRNSETGDYSPPPDAIEDALNGLQQAEQALKDAIEALLKIGVNLKVLGWYPSLDSLKLAITSPNVGDIYGIGDPTVLYLWTGIDWLPLPGVFVNPSGYNLLVNPFFKYNGRNQSIYTGSGFTVDGWRTLSLGKITLEKNGISLQVTEDGQCEFLQYLKNSFSDLAGKTITLSVKVQEQIYSLSGVVPTILPSENSRIIQIPIFGTWVAECWWSHTSSKYYVRINNLTVTTGDSFTVSAAKLEIGSVSTLAADIAGAQNETLEQLRLDMYDLDPGRPAYILTQNENLLGNWYFVGGGSQQGGGQFPINQLSQKIYNAVGITADQWYINNAGMSVTINSDGLLIKHDNTINSEELHQKLPITILKSGQTYCFSALTKEAGIISVTFTYNGQEEFGIGSQITANGYTAAFRMTSGAFSAGHFSVRLITNIANASVTLIAAKLELGFRSTLAHLENGQWVLNDLPNFQQELAKCQRYQVLLGSLTGNTNICLVLSDSTTKAYGFLNTPVPLRINPTILQSSNLSLLSSTLQEIPVTKIQALVIGNSGLYFDVTASGLTANTVYWLRIKLGGIILDANL